MNPLSAATMLLQLILILPIILVSTLEIGDDFPATAIPKVFQLNIQATNTKYRMTTLGKEYYDGVNEKASDIVWAKDGKTQTTYRRRQDKKMEYFTITDDVLCKDVIVADNVDMFVNGSYILTTAYFFSFLPRMKLISKDETHMGIKAAKYGGAVRLGTEDADIEFYWSVPNDNWLFPNCPNVNDCANWWVPLKTVVQMPQPDNTTFQLTYVYYDYKNIIDDPEAFQLPRGVACNLLENTKPFPTNLPIHFEAGVEIYFPLSIMQISAKERVYYNMDRKMIRLDADLPADMKESETAGLDREIWDYNTGVVYKMNSKNGTCTVQNLTQSDVELGERKKSSIGILNSLLDDKLDPNTFHYVGERIYRSLKCDVWISNVTDKPTEIYMINETAKDEDGNVHSYSVPVFLNTSLTDEGMEVQSSAMSFFNYDLKVPSWSRFDTTSCFIEDFKIRFQLELKGEYLDVIDHNPNDFIFQIQTQLATKTKVLPNRFQEILIDDFETPNATDTILFTTTLVENPFNAGHTGSNNGDKKTNQQVYADLSDVIFNSNLTFTFKTEGKSHSYHVISIRDDVVSIPVTSLKDEITASFKQVGVAVITKGIDFQTSGISRMECFENCIDSLEFDCKSWSYCKDTGDCVLSSVLFDHAKEEEFDFKVQTNCELYSRHFLKDYVLNKQTVTEAVGIEIGVEIKPDTEADCAAHCSVEKLPFYCEGFDSCVDPTSEKMMCYFRSRHILEMEPMGIKESKNCNHFTRDYLGDFLKFKNKSAAFKDFDVSVVAAAGAKDCARMCTTSADVNACKGFEMCSPGGVENKPRTQCRILDSSKEPTRKLYDDQTCDHYTRNNFIADRNKSLHPDDRKPTGSPPDPPNTAAAQTSAGGGYSDGSMAGLAFGMIFLGLLVGSGVVIGFMKYKVMQR